MPGPRGIRYSLRCFRDPLRCAVEALAAYLTQILGGPCEYAERRWSLSLREAHLRFKIGEREREAWLNNMRQTLEELQPAGPLRDALLLFFERYSAYLIDSHAVADTDRAQRDSVHQEIDGRWLAEYAVEQAVEAIRRRDARTAIELAGSARLRAHFERDRGALLSLLALMSGSGDQCMLRYVHARLSADRKLAVEPYTYGRILLHDAAGAGSAEIVKLLLRLGANPNLADRAGHTPLYFVGNVCSSETGAEVVRLLVDSGARLDTRDRAKRCTALHMAARRGNVRVAEALLDCGADIEVRDSQGDTPLRRAVNCQKPEVARSLLARGADPYSMGHKGLTPIEAARGPAMKQIFMHRIGA